MAYLPSGWKDTYQDRSMLELGILIVVEPADGSASTTISNDYIQSFDYISSMDVSMLRHQLTEFDLKLSNIDGIWDSDNPDNQLDTVKTGDVIYATVYFTNVDDGTEYNFPLGRFVIKERTADEDSITLVCYDLLITVQDEVTAWAYGGESGLWLSTSLSEISTDMASGLTERGVTNINRQCTDTSEIQPFYCDGGSDMTILDQWDYYLSTVLYGALYLHSDRDGNISILDSSHESALVKTALAYTDYVLETPRLSASADKYNTVAVTYVDADGNPQTYTSGVWGVDTGVRLVYSENCPVIGGGSKRAHWAKTLALTIRYSYISKNTYECKLVGSPEIEVGDRIVIQGRYTMRSFVVVGHTLSFDGDFTSVLQLVPIGIGTWTSNAQTFSIPLTTWRGMEEICPTWEDWLFGTASEGE